MMKLSLAKMNCIAKWYLVKAKQSAWKELKKELKQEKDNKQTIKSLINFSLYC